MNTLNKVASSRWQSNFEKTDSIKQGSLTHEQLEECIGNYRKFHTILNHLNMEAIQFIKSGLFQDALSKLRQGEKMLNYALKAGKNIDQAINITILHNIACAHEGIYNLSDLYNSLETLLQNIHFSLKKSLSQENFENPHYFTRSPSNKEALSEYIRMKTKYGVYLLQYSSLCSKTQNHAQSIKYALEGIQAMKKVCGLCSHYEIEQEQNNLENNMLEELSYVNTKLKGQKYEKYLQKVQKLIKKGFLKEDRQIGKLIQKFSPHKILRLNPISLQESQSLSHLNQECTYFSKLKKLFYIATGYFTISTELRLISSRQTNSLCYSSSEFLLSQIYHLYAILLILKWGRWKSVFLDHLLKSYSNHYGINLEKEDQSWFFKQKKIKIHQFKLEDNLEESEDSSQSSINLDTDEQSSSGIILLPNHSIKIDGESRWSKIKPEKKMYSSLKANLQDRKFYQNLKTSPNIMINNKKITPDKIPTQPMTHRDVEALQRPIALSKPFNQKRRSSASLHKKSASLTERKNSQTNHNNKKKERHGIFIQDLIGTKKKITLIKSKSKEKITKPLPSCQKNMFLNIREGRIKEKKDFNLQKNRQGQKKNKIKEDTILNFNPYFPKERMTFMPQAIFQDKIQKNQSKERKPKAQRKKIKKGGK